MSEKEVKRRVRSVEKDGEKVVERLRGKLKGRGCDLELDALLSAILLLARLAIDEAELVEAYEDEYL